MDPTLFSFQDPGTANPLEQGSVPVGLTGQAGWVSREPISAAFAFHLPTRCRRSCFKLCAGSSGRRIYAHDGIIVHPLLVVCKANKVWKL